MTENVEHGQINSSNAVELRYELAGISQGASQAMQQVAEEYLADLVREVARQEEKTRADGVLAPEITASTVMRAKKELYMINSHSKPSVIYQLAAFISPISAAGAGITGSYFADSNWFAGGTGALLVLAIISTIITARGDRS